MKDDKKRNIIIIVSAVVLAALGFYLGYTFAGSIDVSNDVLLIGGIVGTVIGIACIVMIALSITKKSK